MTDEDTMANAADQPEPPAADNKDPVRRWTLILLVTALVLFIYYLLADRLTPFTSQARVHALVVPIASEVSGTVTEVRVTSNQPVSKGEVLFEIDPTQYQLALAGAEANLESARQATGASAASVTAAEAAVLAAQASLEQAESDANRLRNIKRQDPGAISERRVESAESALDVARQQVAASQANLEQARQAYGAAGDANARILQARSALDQAQVNLGHTRVLAPTDGVVTDVRVDRGNFAGAGAPQMTFISTGTVWVQADLTENNLGHVDVGDEAALIFDVYPGSVFKGRVREMGFGVAVDSAPLGSLPTIQNDRSWLRSAQRFPVLVEFEMSEEDRRRLRVGAQVSVIVYAGDEGILRLIGGFFMRLASWLSYAY